MYGFIDYARGGLFCLNNFLRPRHKKLSQLMIYATTRCQSHCRHCNIWQKPHVDLPLATIRELMASHCVTRNTTVGLEGGEFFLHPESEEIMRFFASHHPNYTLLTNGLTARVVDLSLRYRPRRVYVSLDGDRDTYRVMRGCDGFDSALRVVRALKDRIPVSLMFCLSPWNSFRDMEFVIQLARSLDVDVRIGIYGQMAFFDTTRALLSAEGFAKSIPHSLRQTTENYDFVMLYDEWRRGNLRLRCHSILNQLVVHSNGDVPLCQNLAVKLGNVHRQPLDEIFNGAESCARQCRYARHCNACWINFHRKFDIIMVRTLERVLPKCLIERVYGPYQWAADTNMTYRKKINEVSNS